MAPRTRAGKRKYGGPSTSKAHEDHFADLAEGKEERRSRKLRHEAEEMYGLDPGENKRDKCVATGENYVLSKKSQTEEEQQKTDPFRRVVKIYVTSCKPHYSMPWQMRRQQKSTATGFVMSRRRILTNAHCVAYQSSVRVRRQGSAEKFRARVLAVGHDCDLALLTVEDEQFWAPLEGIPELELGPLPQLQGNVTVVGFPTGGDNLSVTAGVVSRLDMQHYSHSWSKLLAIQIDAAINAGNSGGPAFHNNKVVGIAFETLDDAENIGYIIPTPVVDHFLAEVEEMEKALQTKTQKRYQGFGRLGFQWQATENSHIRAFLELPKDGEIPRNCGVMVTKISPLSGASDSLKKMDVLLEVDGHPIAQDGTIAIRGEERVCFSYLATEKHVGASLAFKIFREGKADAAVKQYENLIPHILYDKLPSYLVHAGLVFTVVSQPFLEAEWGKDWEWKAPVKLVEKALEGMRQCLDEEVVVLSQILSHPVNTGYEASNFVSQQVESFNGEKIKNLAQLAELVRSCKSKYMRFDLTNEKVIVLETSSARAATDEVLKGHNIPSAMSKDLMGVEDI